MMYTIALVIGFGLLLRQFSFGLVVDDLRREGSSMDRGFRNDVKNAMMYSGNAGALPMWIDHGMTWALHLACTVLVGRHFGWATAALWAVLPTNLQQSVWLNGKRYMFATILVMASLSFLPWSGIFYPVALLWQPIAAPALLLLSWPAVVFGVMLFVLCQPLRVYIIEWLESRYNIDCVAHCELTKLTWKKWILVVKVYGFYFWRILFPFKIAFFYQFMDQFGTHGVVTKQSYQFDWMFLRGLAAIAVSIFGLYTPAKDGIVWYALFISMWCHGTIHVTQPIADRYTYIASMGLMSAVCAVVPAEMYWSLYGLYLMGMWNGMLQYRDIEGFYWYELVVEPEETRARRQYAQALYDSRHSQESWRQTQLTLAVDPLDCNANALAARINMTFGRWEQARKYVMAAASNPITGSVACLTQLTEMLTEIEKQIKKKIDRDLT